MWRFYRRFPFVSKNNLDLHLKFTKYLIHIFSVIISWFSFDIFTVNF